MNPLKHYLLHADELLGPPSIHGRHCNDKNINPPLVPPSLSGSQIYDMSVDRGLFRRRLVCCYLLRYCLQLRPDSILLGLFYPQRPLH